MTQPRFIKMMQYDNLDLVGASKNQLMIEPLKARESRDLNLIIRSRGGVKKNLKLQFELNEFFEDKQSQQSLAQKEQTFKDARELEFSL